MSGTSLDGVDIAFCRFSGSPDNPEWEIRFAETIPYDSVWKNRLSQAHKLSGEELAKLDMEYGRYLGRTANAFISKYKCQADFIASHGHTIFHRPESGFTLQIGNGAELAAETKCTTVCDFRSLDVALGGQGAPLVPIGDSILFGAYESCINLGGFANISYEKNNERIAFDICPANMGLNYFAAILGAVYDENGTMASSGKINTDLLSALNDLAFYKLEPPKSLGREWFEQVFLSVITRHKISVQDTLRTITEHIALQIGEATKNHQEGKILITGGGAENQYLISKIMDYAHGEIVIPEKQIIHFKEALVFAFLGWLRLQGRVNTLASVTGASRDSSGGSVYLT